jgi:glycosyltransferase involved in cell wall biosynthesis
MSAHRVAFISHAYLESAVRRKLVYLAQGIDLRFITPSSYPTAYGPYPLDFQFNSGVQTISYPIQFLHLRRTSTRWILLSRDLGFRQFQPDIIHVENEQSSWIMCQALLYRRLFAPRAKVVLFCWDNLRPEEHTLKTRALEYLSLMNRQFVDFFICGNQAGKEILAAKGISAERIAVLPQYGVDPDVFYPYASERQQSCRRQFGILPGHFAVGFVGRFVEEKGVLDLVEATGMLRQASGQAIVLVMAGRGELEGTVRLRCEQLGVPLIVLASCKYNQVVEIMNALDVLVLPSQSRPFWKEQFGRVLIEAMACGTPVIGSDSGEIPNVIGDAGLVFRECDREQLARCLRQCCEGGAFRLVLRERGLERVLDRFTNQTIADQTLRIYDLVNRPSESLHPSKMATGNTSGANCMGSHLGVS